MEYKLDFEGKTKVIITFKETPEGWEQAIEKAYEKTKGKYDIQGFRKGKVPRRVIERTYGEAVFFEDAFAECAEDAYATAMNEHPELQLVGEPDVKLVSFVENKLEGTISFTIIPEVKLGQYKGLTVNYQPSEYSDDMLQAEIKHALSHYTTNEKQEGKITENGDIVIIDFVGSTDGVEFEGGKAEDYELTLGSHSFIDTFEEQLLGHKEGEHVTVNVVFPDDYGAPNLAGKKAVFECDIKSVCIKKEPELNDEFVKTLGDFKTVEEWKADVEAQIRHEIEHKNQIAKEDALLGQIVESSEIELPKEIVDKQLDSIIKDLSYRLAYQGMRLEDYANYIGKTVEELREERRNDAVRIAKTKQVLEALVRKENVKVENEEIEAKIEESAKIANKTTEEYKKTMEPKRFDYIYSDILMHKLIDFLCANNTIECKTTKAESKKETAKTTKTTTKKTTK